MKLRRGGRGDGFISWRNNVLSPDCKVLLFTGEVSNTFKETLVTLQEKLKW